MAGRILEAGLHLLDRQLIDRDGRLAGKVDDLELEVPEGGGPPVVTAILAGPGALSRRVARVDRSAAHWPAFVSSIRGMAASAASVTSTRYTCPRPLASRPLTFSPM